MKKRAIKQAGFTIVELLIVIVVIAILAAISVVAYNGIQNRAEDSKADAGLSQLKKTLEVYRIQEGHYPSVCLGGDGYGCPVSDLAPELVPTYVADLPGADGLYSYVRDVGGQGYGIYMRYQMKPDCKTGVNVSVGWWGTSLPSC